MSTEIIWDEELRVRYPIITFSDGDVCPTNTSRKLGMQIEVKCNPDAVERKSVGVILDDSCSPYILQESVHGCAIFTMSGWFVYIAENPLIVGIVLVLFGAVTCFRGRKFFDKVLGFVGFLAGFVFSMLIFSAFGWVDYLDPFAEKESKLIIAIIAILLAAIIGAIVGFLLFYFAAHVGVLVLAIVVGFFAGITLYNTFLHFIGSGWVMLACGVLGAIILGVLAKIYHDFIMILGTSFLGAYALVRGFSYFFGGFPDEVTMFNSMRNGVEVEFENTFYYYLIAIVLFFILGYWW
jgi:hypothetical protein